MPDDPAARRRRAAVAAGKFKRLSAADLRERGVDETFLTPAACIGDAPVVAVDVFASSVAFVRPSINNRVNCLNDTGAGHVEIPSKLGQQHMLLPSVEHMSHFGGGHVGSTPLQAPQAPRTGIAERERALSTSELRAEYGKGYELLARMGYKGGGMVPLTATKRQPGLALQDDEISALDRSGPRPRPIKRRKNDAACATPQQSTISYPISQSDLAARQSIDGSDSSPETQSFEESLSDVAGEGNKHDGVSYDVSLLRLRRTILREVARGGRSRLLLKALSKRPRVRRAMNQLMSFAIPTTEPEVRRFLVSFIKENVPLCRLGSAAATEWMKSTRDGNIQKGEQMLVILKTDDELKFDQSQSDGESCSSSSNCTLRFPDRGVRGRNSGLTCHGCQRNLPSLASLRQHILEHLTKETTSDPTDLMSPLDVDHVDRDRLNEAWGELQNQQRLWCPGCSCWLTNRSPNPLPFDSLLNHASGEHTRIICDDEGKTRHPSETKLSHHRLLMLITELILRDLPPKRSVGTHRDVDQKWPGADVVQLFTVVTSGNAAAYATLETKLLGPLEEDIFCTGEVGVKSEPDMFRESLPEIQ